MVSAKSDKVWAPETQVRDICLTAYREKFCLPQKSNDIRRLALLYDPRRAPDITGGDVMGQRGLHLWEIEKNARDKAGSLVKLINFKSNFIFFLNYWVSKNIKHSFCCLKQVESDFFCHQECRFLSQIGKCKITLRWILTLQEWLPHVEWKAIWFIVCFTVP